MFVSDMGGFQQDIYHFSHCDSTSLNAESHMIEVCNCLFAYFPFLCSNFSHFLSPKFQTRKFPNQGFLPFICY